jgi:hypothetical protein
MPEELIHKIINDLKSIPVHVPFDICLFKVNEPFLDKRIFDVARRINAELPNASLRFFSNGSSLTESILSNLELLQHVKQLWISLNHHDPVEYQRIMKMPFDRTIRRLHEVQKAVQEGRLTIPVTVSRVSDGSPDDAAFTEFVTREFPNLTPIIISRADWAGQIEKAGNVDVKPTGCSRWFELSILSTGKVALCCMDGEGKHIIGDLNHQSILEVYNSPGYRKLRDYHSNRLGCASPCDGCTL